MYANSCTSAVLACTFLLPRQVDYCQVTQAIVNIYIAFLTLQRYRTLEFEAFSFLKLTRHSYQCRDLKCTWSVERPLLQ